VCRQGRERVPPCGAGLVGRRPAPKSPVVQQMACRWRLRASLLLAAVARVLATSLHISVEVPAMHCIGRGDCACKTGWMGSRSVGEQRARRLVHVHIPKTGGTSIEAWAFKHHIRLHTRHQHGKCPSLLSALCNTTHKPFFGNSTSCGSNSNRHCVQSYAAAFADPEEQTFSVVREPLARAVSTFNMRQGRNMKCSPEKLASYIRNIYLHGSPGRGDPDNHDRPQVEFAAVSERILCFDRLQQDFTQLLRHAHQLAEPTGLDLPFLAPLLPFNLSERAVDRFFALPHSHAGTHHVQGNCSVADLPGGLRDELLARFSADAALHRRVCSSESFSTNLQEGARPHQQVARDRCVPNVRAAALTHSV